MNDLYRPLLWLIVFAFAVLLTACGGDGESLRLDRRTLVEAEAILEDVTRTELGLSSQTASIAGLTDMAPEGNDARLDDHSQAGFERARLIRIDLLKRLQQSPDMPKRHPLARDLIVLRDSVYRLNVLQQTGRGRLGPDMAFPYSIDPVSGIWRDGPYLLRYEQSVRTVAEAQAWLSRLSAVAGAYDDTRRRLIADHATGHTPPKLLLEETAASLRYTLEDGDTYGKLALTFNNLLTSASGIGRTDAETLSSQAEEIIVQQVLPSHRALTDYVDQLIEDAPQLPGLSGQPNGYEMWRALTAWHSPGLLESEDLHAEHMAEVTERQTALQTIIERLPLSQAPDGDVPDTEIVRREADYIAALTPPVAEPAGAIDAAIQDSPAPIALPRSTGLSQRTTDLTHRLTFGSTLFPAARDGRRPDLILINSQDTALWPEWWTGYHLERINQPWSRDYLISLNETAKRTPARILFRNTDFKLGWGAYAAAFPAQDLDEEPPLKAAYLLAKFELIVAALASLDTGMHTQRWSLDECVTFLDQTLDLPAPLTRQLVTQIAARPGEASARLYGQKRFRSLEQRARAVLTSRFDAPDFRFTLLSGGPRPFFMVEEDVERWYEGQIGR